MFEYRKTDTDSDITHLIELIENARPFNIFPRLLSLSPYLSHRFIGWAIVSRLQMRQMKRINAECLLHEQTNVFICIYMNIFLHVLRRFSVAL